MSKDAFEAYLRERDVDRIRYIRLDELSNGDQLFVYVKECDAYANVRLDEFEVWKVYKTATLFHFLQFKNKQLERNRLLDYYSNRTKSVELHIEDYVLYSYYDIERPTKSITLHAKNSSEVIGLKISSSIQV
jgi:hypothetical protein